MNLVYCFIGTLPQYSIDTVHQARLFYDGPIYFIISDFTTSIHSILQTKYNVTIVNYNDVIHNDFRRVATECRNKFCILPGLHGREQLFIYSFERFFVLLNLMIQKSLTNVLFPELDNLLYDDPRVWEERFCEKDIAYMYDNHERCASGIAFFKNIEGLASLSQYFLNTIPRTTTFLNEMTMLYNYLHLHKDTVQIIPTHWNASNVPEITYRNYEMYKGGIFDAAALGIFLGGMDPFHTNGKVVKGLKGSWSAIDYTSYRYEWREDEMGRRIPYVFNASENVWIKINNLHIHSKVLVDCLSRPIE